MGANGCKPVRFLDMALTGFLVGNVCYPSAGAASDAFFAAQSSSVVGGSGNSSLVNVFEKISGVWNLSEYSVTNLGVWSLKYSTAAYVPAFPGCDPVAGFQDGFALAGVVTVAVLVVVAASLVRKAL